jgi:hypothetical protein
MASKRRKPRGMKTNPVIWAFCEGETEKNYLRFLKKELGIKIKVNPKVSGTEISNYYVRKHLSDKDYNPRKDTIVLLYDGDRQDVLKKVTEISNAEKLISTPNIELWFLLHYREQTAEISSEIAVKILEKENPGYSKNDMNSNLRVILKENYTQARDRAEKLEYLANPSSNVYELRDILGRK